VVARWMAATDLEHVRRCRLDQLGTTEVASPATIVIGAVAALDVRSTPATLATGSVSSVE